MSKWEIKADIPPTKRVALSDEEKGRKRILKNFFVEIGALENGFWYETANIEGSSSSGSRVHPRDKKHSKHTDYKTYLQTRKKTKQTKTKSGIVTHQPVCIEKDGETKASVMYGNVNVLGTSGEGKDAIQNRITLLDHTDASANDVLSKLKLLVSDIRNGEFDSAILKAMQTAKDNYNKNKS